MTFSPDHRLPPPYGRDEHIDRSQETYQPSPHASRVTPPSGKVAPDGKRSYPQPARSSKLLVWGGIGVAAAAVTAGSILGVRAIVDAVSGNDEDDAVEAARRRAKARRRHGQPRPMPRNAFSGPRDGGVRDGGQRVARDDGERTAARDEARREERERIERERRRARATAQRPGFSTQVEDVARTIRNTLGTVTAAIEGFRSVSGQAGSIMNEFRGAADTVRTMFDSDQARAATPPRKPRQPAQDMVDLRDQEPRQQRTHRL